MNFKSALLCSTIMCVAMPALAEEKRELSAHMHGHGALNIAIEGTQLIMELEVPGFDIVGFEHAATSDADKAAIETALAQLSKPMDLISLPEGAGCQLSDSSVELQGEEGHDGDHHDEEHDHGHDDHADDHDDHSDGENHSEFHASYEFACDDPSTLSKIDLTYFNVFPNAEELAVQVVTDAGASKVEASADMPTIKLN